LDWIETTHQPDGALPEQVPDRRTDAWFHAYRTERWGASASPLTWSHALVILAREAVSTAEADGRGRVE